eukprot:5171718-Alexandrium_andersonii.AAC.1
MLFHEVAPPLRPFAPGRCRQTPRAERYILSSQNRLSSPIGDWSLVAAALQPCAQRVRAVVCAGVELSLIHI